MSSCFADQREPMPVSMRTFAFGVFRSRQFVVMRMRFFSSAGVFFSQRTFGTTPNMAPPSRRKRPSGTMCRSKAPNLMPALSAIVTLKDGRTAVIRPLAPADAGALAEFNRAAAEDYGRQVPEPEEAVTDARALEEMLKLDGESEETEEILLRKEEGHGETPEDSLRKGRDGVGAVAAGRAGGFLLGAFVGPNLAGTVSLFVVSLRKGSHVA